MKNNENKISFKIITLGDTNVGKTSIICRYIENIFYPNILATIGLNKSQKEITLKEGIKITLDLQDTSGQEKYRSTSKLYTKNADGVLFIFDLSNKESFYNIKEWIKIFDENNSYNSVPKFLIGNKKDLEREIEQDLIDIFSEENKIKYKETSAKDENDNNINELFQELGEQLYEKYKKNGKRNSKIKKLNSHKSHKISAFASNCCA